MYNTDAQKMYVLSMLDLHLVLRPHGNGLGVGEDLNLPIQNDSISSSFEQSPFKLIQSIFGKEFAKVKL